MANWNSEAHSLVTLTNQPMVVIINWSLKFEINRPKSLMIFSRSKILLQFLFTSKQCDNAFTKVQTIYCTVRHNAIQRPTVK